MYAHAHTGLGIGEAALRGDDHIHTSKQCHRGADARVGQVEASAEHHEAPGMPLLYVCTYVCMSDTTKTPKAPFVCMFLFA